jgi:hypothetical protein
MMDQLNYLNQIQKNLFKKSRHILKMDRTIMDILIELIALTFQKMVSIW